MVKVIASTRGYIDGEIREAGDSFDIDDALWKDEARRPKWVVPYTPERAAAARQDSTRKPVKTAARPAAGSTGPKGDGVQQEPGGPPPDWLPQQQPDPDSPPAD